MAARLTNLAWGLLAAMPLVMAVANRSAPLILLLAAVAALAGAALNGRLNEARVSAGAALRRPLGLVALAFVALAILSLGWSDRPILTLHALAEAGIPALAAFSLASTLGRPPRWVLTAFAGAFVAACLYILADFGLHFAISRALGGKAVSYAYNRPVITLLVVYWPLALWLVRTHRKPAAFAFGALLLVTILRATSGASNFGVMASVPILLIALVSRRIAFGLVAAGLLGMLAVAPVQGDLSARFIPQRIVAALASVHAADRIEIWQAFGDVVRARPLLGTGFGTSVPGLSADPVAQSVRPEARAMLDVGHPHDAFLQIWAELGLIGAALAAAIFALTLRALAHAKPLLAPPSLAMIAASIAIACVGHGAWQGWWIGALGAAILWFRAAAQQERIP